MLVVKHGWGTWEKQWFSQKFDQLVSSPWCQEIMGSWMDSHGNPKITSCLGESTTYREINSWWNKPTWSVNGLVWWVIPSTIVLSSMALILIEGLHGLVGMSYFLISSLCMRFKAAPESIITVNEIDVSSVFSLIGSLNDLLLRSEKCSILPGKLFGFYVGTLGCDGRLYHSKNIEGVVVFSFFLPQII